MSNKLTFITLAFTVWQFTSVQAQTLSQSYPGDINISSDPNVVVTEDFEDAAFESQWALIKNKNKVQLVSDRSNVSSGNRAAKFLGNPSSPAIARMLPGNFDQVYVRYYVKYYGDTYHHAGIGIGGHESQSISCSGCAGYKGIYADGKHFFKIMFETNNNNNRLDFYTYWINMPGNPDGQGNWYGRSLLKSLAIKVPVNQWKCIEYMTKLNSTPTSKDGELALWIDGQSIVHFKTGQPKGYTNNNGHFTFDNSKPAFEGFTWRAKTNYGINWVKVQNFDSPDDVAYDDLVVATKRIGCISQSHSQRALGKPGQPIHSGN